MLEYNVFMSYALKNSDAVGYADQLIRCPDVKTFVAERSVLLGDPLDEEIKKGIRACNLFVVLLSKESESSIYVNQEIGYALSLRKPILPILLDKIKLPGMLNSENPKYVDVYRDPSKWQKFREAVLERANNYKLYTTIGILILILIAAIVF